MFTKEQVAAYPRAAEYLKKGGATNFCNWRDSALEIMEFMLTQGKVWWSEYVDEMTKVPFIAPDGLIRGH